MSTSALPTRESMSFGPFNLIASERHLTKNGVPVPLGARALEILIALVSRPNEAISKRELLAQVWPDVTVEEGSLRFHIAGLRKALGDGKDGARYIATLAGRGYCFVAPVKKTHPKPAKAADVASHAIRLPKVIRPVIGRADIVAKLAIRLQSSRLVTVVGPGGIGKTTVALEVAALVAPKYPDGVFFIDLSSVNEDGSASATAEQIATLPLCWLGAAEGEPAWQHRCGEPLPLVALEAPCLLRSFACEHLDRAGLTWRIAFVSPSLGGLWAATAAGLVALRTPIGRPQSVRLIDPEIDGLPDLPSLGLVLHRANKDIGPAGEHLATIIKQALRECLPAKCLSLVQDAC
jgi:DNA-binding winged helix-turn-helix (wHTH) protein